VGTVIRRDHPALRAFPHEGWCDLCFYPLLQGAKVVNLKDLPVNPIVRALDVHTAMRDKAYVFEAKVGAGRLLVSTFNFRRALKSHDPGAEFLLDELVRYALSDAFQPETEVSTR
jgi:hypothetical protein